MGEKQKTLSIHYSWLGEREGEINSQRGRSMEKKQGSDYHKNQHSGYLCV